MKQNSIKQKTKESRETKSKLQNLQSKAKNHKEETINEDGRRKGHNGEKRLETVMDGNYLSREEPCSDTILGNKGK